MSTQTKAKKSTRTTAAEPARRAKLAKIRRAEDKADLAIAKKVCTRLDSGEGKAIPWEDFVREVAR